VSALGEAALLYAARGLRVLPLAVASKAPHALAPNGVHSATDDPGIVSEIWTEAPNANVGIALGKYGDGRYLVAIDLDNHGGRHGTESFKELLDLLVLPERRMVRTPGGGFHLLYWSPTPLPNTRDEFGDGIETYSTGRYIVAPPSIHPNHGVYAAAGIEEITEIPAVLLERFSTRQDKGSTSNPATDKTPAVPPTPLQPELEDVRAWGGYRPFAEKAAARFGITIDQRFRPTWRDASGESAQITSENRGLYVCFDNGSRADPKSMILPEWYAALAIGQARALSSMECVIWTKRAQAELGYRTLAPPPAGLPLDDLDSVELAVFEGFLLRWQLRGEEPGVAYAVRWIPGWIGKPGISYTRANTAVLALRAKGLIHLAGKSPSDGRLFIYRLGDGTPDPALPSAKPLGAKPVT